ncbi:MAG: septum formation initiator family protein [Pseudomonadota bacterium]
MNRKYLVILILGICVTLFFTTFGQRKIIHIYHLTKERNQTKTFSEKIKEENRNLKEEIYSLKRDNKYIEGIARQELGLVKEDEIIYEFKTPKNEDRSLDKEE